MLEYVRVPGFTLAALPDRFDVEATWVEVLLRLQRGLYFVVEQPAQGPGARQNAAWFKRVVGCCWDKFGSMLEYVVVCRSMFLDVLHCFVSLYVMNCYDIILQRLISQCFTLFTIFYMFHHVPTL